MVTEELLEFVMNALALRKTREEITSSLINCGWSDKAIKEAFDEVNIKKDVKESELLPLEVKRPESSNKLINYLFGILGGERKFKFFLIAIFLALISSVYPVYSVINFGKPFLKDIDKRLETLVKEVFPEELEITIKDGRASTNVSEPYHLVVSQSTLLDFVKVRSEKEKPVSKIRILTLNTSGSVEDFERFQTLAMLTGSSLVFYNDDNIQIESLRSVPDMLINRDLIITKINEVNKDNKIVKLLEIILYLSPIVIIIGLLVNYLLVFLSSAVIIWLINKVLSLGISFGKLLKFSAALYLFPSLVLILISLFPQNEVYYVWFDTGMDILVYATAYVLLVKYRADISKSER